MRVLIVGGGVTGTMVAAALHEAGGDATLLVRPDRQAHLIGGRAKITSPFGRFSAPLNAVTASALTGPFDVIMLATRADNVHAARMLVDVLITDDTVIVPLFDGLQHLDLWREQFPTNRVAGAVFEARATMDADGGVRQSGPLGCLHLGPLDGVPDERLDALVAALGGRRFSAEVDHTILTRIWARHVYLAAATGAAVRADMTFRDAFRFHSRIPFEGMLEEGIRTGEALGILRLRSAVRRYRTAFMMEGEPVQSPSMTGAGRSENLFLLSAMLRQSQLAGVDAPRLLAACSTVAAQQGVGEPAIAPPALA
jgi:2-dehydropantoate 2-reductase